MGFQRLEWCSDHHNSFTTIGDPNWGNHPMALPVIASNFTLSAASGCRVHNPESSPDHDVVFMLLCF
jgi:hypothetical protein